jgi:hypothetical protein
LDPGADSASLTLGGVNSTGIIPTSGFPGAFDACTSVTVDNCKSNVFAYCIYNFCPWYATSCATNEPLYSNSNICPTYVGQTCPSQDGLLSPRIKPVAGSIISDEDLDSLRRSISGEFTNRRWVITDVSAIVAPLEGDVVDDADFNAVKTFMENIIERTSHTYDFYTDALSGNLAPTSAYTIDGGYSLGTVISGAQITELCDLIDQIRTDCICVNNCVCFSDCTCNWNCACNY